ncbi:DegT/DnrJ/EryC1/StrS family aminotransferase [Natronomonas halophila]|uniref:DegT/DnrJ/EryC1/StrS family aminotransferase n=1 Tax=Natronomonas halophila TaxID=2747817 RepID=UPI0015B63FED|nr:DegT/DnrJ/EryC1/StrS family aminotransferase [Natronomonas halophila]QLD87129.1 DegT/DnrJ/EryC1/StrS family aminotransferase [Natronomonas halophila]
MQQDEPSSVERLLERATGSEGWDRPRRFRHVPAAVTPLGPADIAAGVAGQLSAAGRDEFRNDIGAFLDATAVGTYTSFRRALGACLLELDAKTAEDRTEVLIPAFCSLDFPDAIEGVGLDFTRYDVDPETMALDMDAIQALPTDDTLAIVAVNVLGYGSSMDEIESYCRDNDIFLVEALGYALGAEYEGDRLGTFGDCSVLNFQQGKPIPVGGGMVVSRNDDLEFADEGRPAVSPNLGVLSGYAAFGHPRLFYVYSQASDWLDRFSGDDNRFSTHPEAKFGVPYEPPFATLSNFQGAIASRVFDRLEDHRRQREHTARVYASELADCPGIRHVRPVDGLSKHQHVRYPILVDGTERRAELERRFAEAGIGTAALYDWPPLDAEEFPGAARLQDEILTLPTHPYVDAADRQRIVGIVRDVMGACRS